MATQAIDRALLAELRARNIKTAEISYSGGNDDGGCDRCDLTFEDGTVGSLSPAYVSESSGAYEQDEHGQPIPAGVKVTHRFERGRSFYVPATDAEVKAFALVEKLTAPVYARYGSFAGDFSCHGTLTYDVESGQLEMVGYESSYSEVEW